jgi:hypothetical protein
MKSYILGEERGRSVTELTVKIQGGRTDKGEIRHGADMNRSVTELTRKDSLRSCHEQVCSRADKERSVTERT